MNYFSFDEMEMLASEGWAGDFIENIEEGDEIALKTRMAYDLKGNEPAIKFVRVTKLSRIPRYERSGDWGMGPIINADSPNYLLQFVGVHESGLQEPMSFGAGWPIFRKVPQTTSPAA